MGNTVIAFSEVELMAIESILMDDDKNITEVLEQAGGDISRERIEKLISLMSMMSTI